MSSRDDAAGEFSPQMGHNGRCLPSGGSGMKAMSAPPVGFGAADRFGVDAGSIVPEGIEAYCRIFHPFGRHAPRAVTKSWDQVAAENSSNRPSRDADPPDQSTCRITIPSYALNDYLNELDWGTPPVPERMALLPVLRDHTRTPESCWFCVWDGFGGLDCGGSARVELPMRSYALFSGPIDLALASLEPPPWDVELEYRDSPRIRNRQISGGPRIGPGSLPQKSTSPGPTSGGRHRSSKRCWTPTDWRHSRLGSATSRSPTATR